MGKGPLPPRDDILPCRKVMAHKLPQLSRCRLQAGVILGIEALRYACLNEMACNYTLTDIPRQRKGLQGLAEKKPDRHPRVTHMKTGHSSNAVVCKPGFQPVLCVGTHVCRQDKSPRIGQKI